MNCRVKFRTIIEEGLNEKFSISESKKLTFFDLYFILFFANEIIDFELSTPTTLQECEFSFKISETAPKDHPRSYKCVSGIEYLLVINPIISRIVE